MKTRGNKVLLNEAEYDVLYSIKSFVSALRRSEYYDVNDSVRSQAEYLMGLYDKHVDLSERITVRQWFNDRKAKKAGKAQKAIDRWRA